MIPWSHSVNTFLNGSFAIFQNKGHFYPYEEKGQGPRPPGPHVVARLGKGKPMYNACVAKCLLETALILGHQLSALGWSVPSLAAFTFPVPPTDPYLLLGGQ